MRSTMIQAVSLGGVLVAALGFFLVFAQYGVTTEMVEVLEVAGPGISIGGYLSPVQTVVEAVRRGSLEDLPVPVFVSQLSLCVVSIAYGAKIGNLPILVTNGFGAAVQTVWLSCWYLLRWRQGGKRAVNPFIFSILLSLSIVGAASLISKLDVDFIGVCSLLLSFTFSFSPLAQLPLIIRTRSSASIPLAMAGMMFLGNLCWGVYGYLLGIRVILIPCMVGLEISLLLVFVNLWCLGLFPLDLSFLAKLAPTQDHEATVSLQPVVPQVALD